MNDLCQCIASTPKIDPVQEQEPEDSNTSSNLTGPVQNGITNGNGAVENGQQQQKQQKKLEQQSDTV